MQTTNHMCLVWEIGEGRFQKDGLPAGNYLFLFKDVNNCAYFEGGAIWDEHPLP